MSWVKQTQTGMTLLDQKPLTDLQGTIRETAKQVAPMENIACTGRSTAWTELTLAFKNKVCTLGRLLSQ